MDVEGSLSRLDSSVGLGAEEEGGPGFDASGAAAAAVPRRRMHGDEDEEEDDPIVASMAASRGAWCVVFGGG